MSRFYSSATSLPDQGALCIFTSFGQHRRTGWWNGEQIEELVNVDMLATLLTSGVPLSEQVAQQKRRETPFRLEDVTLLAPIDHQEVWAAGVTYERSRDAREQESAHAADVYARVYEAERPELFYKGNVWRSVGPDDEIRVRSDARWTVPEPELALLIDREMRIAGYTIGNDVSSRDIEGANPLYLPQAKVYVGSCALGPCIVPVEGIADPYNLRITCSIARGGATVWEDETNTRLLHRTLDDLVSYLGRDNVFRQGVFLLTGTCLVPPDTLTLESGDVVTIGIDGLGVLRNTVA